MTTGVQIDRETYTRLVAMSKVDGVSLGAIIRIATEAPGRQRFAQRVATELAELRTDREAWASYLVEAESTSVTDGLG